MLARQRLAFGAGRGIAGPRRRQRRAAASTAPRSAARSGSAVCASRACASALLSLLPLGRQLLDLRVDGGEPGGDLRRLRAQLLMRRARPFQPLLALGPRGARLLLRLGRRAVCRGCGLTAPRVASRALAGDGQVALQQPDSRLRCCSRTAAAVGVPARIV